MLAIFTPKRVAGAAATLAAAAVALAALTEVGLADLRHAMKLAPPVPPDVEVGALYAVGRDGRIPRDARPVCELPRKWHEEERAAYFARVGPYDYALRNWLGASLPKVLTLVDFLGDGEGHGVEAGGDEVLPATHYQIALRLSATELKSESTAHELVAVAGRMIAANPSCEKWIRAKWRQERLCVVMIDRLVKSEDGTTIGFSFHPQCIVTVMPDGDYSHGPLVAPEPTNGVPELMASFKKAVSLVQLAGHHEVAVAGR